jgi:hypothetical protein
MDESSLRIYDHSRSRRENANCWHLCFRAPSREAVDLFYSAALVGGGRDDGAPGVRPHLTIRHEAGGNGIAVRARLLLGHEAIAIEDNRAED